MILYHLTHKENVTAILRQGLRCGMSAGARPVIWLVKRESLGWAVGHVGDHNGCDGGRLVLFRVDVGKDRLRYSGRAGVYWSVRDIEPARVARVGAVADLLTVGVLV